MPGAARGDRARRPLADQSEIDGAVVRHPSQVVLLLVAVEKPTGKPTPLVVLRVDPDEREALLSIGHPFFVPRARRDRIGVLLTDDTDWEEIRELVTQSYRILAPKN